MRAFLEYLCVVSVAILVVLCAATVIEYLFR